MSLRKGASADTVALNLYDDIQPTEYSNNNKQTIAEDPDEYKKSQRPKRLPLNLQFNRLLTTLNTWVMACKLYVADKNILRTDDSPMATKVTVADNTKKYVAAYWKRALITVIVLVLLILSPTYYRRVYNWEYYYRLKGSKETMITYDRYVPINEVSDGIATDLHLRKFKSMSDFKSRTRLCSHVTMEEFDSGKLILQHNETHIQSMYMDDIFRYHETILEKDGETVQFVTPTMYMSESIRIVPCMCTVALNEGEILHMFNPHMIDYHLGRKSNKAQYKNVLFGERTGRWIDVPKNMTVKYSDGSSSDITRVFTAKDVVKIHLCMLFNNDHYDRQSF
jgi:hypothetical protein